MSRSIGEIVAAGRSPSIGDLVAAEARTWIGTPFHWGQSQKGQGCDCKGLVAGVAREIGRPEAASFYARFASYRRDRPVPVALLKEGLAELLDPAPRGAALEDGTVLLLRWRGKAQHLAIVTGGGSRAVHAQIEPNDRVKETDLRALLKLCPLESAWRFPTLEEEGL